MDNQKNLDLSNQLAYWQEKYERARSAYSLEHEAMDRRENLYLGDKGIRSPNGALAPKDASNVRNLAFELVESQISSVIPQPKVTAVSPQNQNNARSIEDKLRNELDRLPFEVLNDQQERTTFIQGGSIMLVEWDSSRKSHASVGELSVRLIHPKQFIPQPGVDDVQEMDYFFLETALSRDAVQRRYGVEIQDGFSDAPKDTDGRELITLITGYYRNPSGIGRISWVGNQLLENLDNYLARRLERCSACGKPRIANAALCQCGSRSFGESVEKWETLGSDILRADGSVIPLYTGRGEQRRKTRIPYYKLNRYPVVVRKNVSVYGRFLGNSDVEALEDQQNSVKKLATKIEEKLLKGGSFVLLPRGKMVRRTDEELKVIELDGPDQKAMIDVVNVQPDVSRDMAMLEQNYLWAKSTLGISDSFQGKADQTAVSGRAKEFSANQTAGRLESKRIMKQAAYGELFQLMFQMLLCCADEPRPVRSRDIHGSPEYRTFSKYDFLEQDAAGEWFYNDGYLFSTDTAGTLANNREAMWQETRVNYRDGAFGQPGSLQALLMFWEVMEGLSYPLASQIKSQIEAQIKEQQNKEVL